MVRMYVLYQHFNVGLVEQEGFSPLWKYMDCVVDICFNNQDPGSGLAPMTNSLILLVYQTPINLVHASSGYILFLLFKLFSYILQD